MGDRRKRIPALLRRIGLKRRLFIGFVIVSLLPMAVLGVIMGVRLYHTIMDNYEEQSIQALGTIQYRIGIVTGAREERINAFASDADVVKSVRKLNMDISLLDRTALTRDLQGKLLAELSQIKGGVRAEILDRNGEFVTGIFDDRYTALSGEARARAKESPDRLHLWHGTEQEGEEIIVFSRQIINYFNGRTTGWVLLYVGTDELKEEMKTVQTDAVIAVYDEEGGLICSGAGNGSIADIADGDLNEAGFRVSGYRDSEDMWKADWKLESGRYQVLFQNMAGTGWEIAIFKDYHELVRSFAGIGILAAVICLVSIGIIICLSLLITRTVAEPVQNIAESMKIFSQGNLSVRVTDDAADEIGMLGNEFNSMSNNIERLTHEVYEARIKEKEAGLRALEAQINPHFLYNTLDMINWMSYRSSNQDICKIVKSLSDFFKLSLNHGKELYTVGDEVRHIQSYVTIEQYKKAEIDFEIHVDEELKPCICPKLIVQPLVENAILHGIEPKRGPGTIIISFVRRENDIVITVEDDGVGLCGKQREGARYHHGGYGLQNINERLTMLYGKKYHVTVEERMGGGVISSVVIPLIGLEGLDDVSDDCRG